MCVFPSQLKTNLHTDILTNLVARRYMQTTRDATTAWSHDSCAHL